MSPTTVSFTVGKISAEDASAAIEKIKSILTVLVIDIVIASEQDGLFTTKVTVDCASSAEMA